MLYIVPTPIGNLKDITLRALETLKEVDAILCEDTRTSSKLLNHYQIKKPLIPYHQHNEHKIVPNLISQLLSNKKFALITDAGTPGISDPAFLLIRACVENQIKVECLPGATAFVPALVVSGLPTNNFLFEGFLPLKKGRATKLTQLAKENYTIILYESPMRIAKTLKDLVQYFGGERKAAVMREITKLFEEQQRGNLTELLQFYENKKVKGEIVIVLEGRG